MLMRSDKHRIIRFLKWCAEVALGATLWATAHHAHAQSVSNPGADCQQSPPAVERLVCGDQKLGELDRKIAETFQRALGNAPDIDRSALLSGQQRWLDNRATVCGLGPNQTDFHALEVSSPQECLTQLYEQWQSPEYPSRRRAYGPLKRSEIPFETTTQPFLPHLLVSKDNELCNAFLSGLRSDFLRRHRGYDYVFREPQMALGRWIVWPAHLGKKLYPWIDVADWDLDGNGRKQQLLHVTENFNWRQNSYFLLIRPQSGTSSIEDDVRAFSRATREGGKTPPLISIAQPPFSLPLWTGYESPFRILVYQGGLYLYGVTDGVTAFNSMSQPGGTARLQRLHANGSLETRCEVSVAPKAGTLPLPWPVKSLEELTVPPKVTEWMRTIRDIQGTEGQMSGTLHALQRTIVSSSYVWYDALVRPWEQSTTQRPDGHSADFLRTWIARWGYKSLSRYRLVRSFETAENEVRSALADYYERAFGVPNGRETDLSILKTTVELRFYYTEDENSDSGRYLYVTTPTGSTRIELRVFDWAHYPRTSLYLTPDHSLGVVTPGGNDYVVALATLRAVAAIAQKSFDDGWQYLGAFDFQYFSVSKRHLRFVTASQQPECIPKRFPIASYMVRKAARHDRCEELVNRERR